MAYSDYTFNDKNPVKRWLQSHRLTQALRIAAGLEPESILDFGAGNGELCKRLAARFPTARIICYDPTPSLLAEAKENLADLPRIHFCSDLVEITDSSIDAIFCLEVFEHLPETETAAALQQFSRLLASQGHAIIGVPIEIGIPALYRGLFRMTRRFGTFDASVTNVLRATLRSPPGKRPVVEIAPGFFFHNSHMGFDHRKLQNTLHAQFSLKKVMAGPFPHLGTWLNSEVNFLVQKNALVISGPH